MRHFLDIAETAAADLRAIIDASRAMKDARAGRTRGAPDDARPLAGRMLAMVFEKPSTRTRVSFDMAMRQLGGETMLLNGSEMQLGRGESLADTGRVLSRYVDAIMLRTTGHEKLMEMAEAASVPVINALTDDSHPCQIMADIMTIEEHRGPIAGKKLAWTGDGNNLAQTFIEAAPRFDFDLSLATPETLDVAERYLTRARAEGGRIVTTRDPAEAAAGADAVITDTWLSMHDTGEARERRHNLLRPYQVDARLMARAKPDALFLHCLPAHRGEEATAEVMDGPQSVIFDEAENRLHAQKGILRWCLGAL
ncbi:ornithine carbamoyltransferase [Rubrimonas cliftonensis]|nr:ornithine carbamoyltransferase [Rubrimonas cliftonensis]